MPIARKVRAGAIVRDGDRVVLTSMLDRGEPPVRWYAFPGGGVEKGEALTDAVLRELFEETALRGELGRELAQVGSLGMVHHYFEVRCADLTLGECSGPELEYAAGQDFRAEWIEVACLADLPVWPRSLADWLAAEARPAGDGVPWIDDDGGVWSRTGWPEREHPRRAVLVIRGDGGVGVVESAEAGAVELPWVDLPTGTTVDEVVRGAKLGVGIRPRWRLANVVVVGRGLDCYVLCDVAPGSEPVLSSTSTFVFAEGGALASGDRDLRPAWVREFLPTWLRDSRPDRVDHFTELAESP